MRRIAIATAAALVAIGALPSAFAQSNTFTVDCDRGKKIATALALGDFRKPLVINVKGACREFVTVTRANVTLRGDPAAEIVAPDNEHDLLTVTADGATIENLTLTGGLTGLAAEHTPAFVARNCVIQDSSSTGVRVRAGDARLNACTVQRSGGIGVSVTRGGSVVLSGGSQVLDSARAGISATRNSIVNLVGSTVMRSGAQGILLGEGSQGSITNGSTISENAGNGIDVAMSQANVTGGNTIRDNGGWGIGGHGSPITIDDNTIAGNTGDGVMGYIGSTLVLHGNVIRSNQMSGVACVGNCLVQIGGASIDNNVSSGITLAWGAKLILEQPVTDVDGNQAGFALWCGDSESSVNDASLLNTSQVVECTDFNN
jgi:hypothetical protein